MKVAELKDKDLDYWVAKALNLDLIYDNPPTLRDSMLSRYEPSVDWEYGGPIIHKQFIGLNAVAIDDWIATLECNNNTIISGYGETPLIAAMRCFVASKFGEEVESIPD